MADIIELGREQIGKVDLVLRDMAAEIERLRGDLDELIEAAEDANSDPMNRDYQARLANVLGHLKASPKRTDPNGGQVTATKSARYGRPLENGETDMTDEPEIYVIVAENDRLIHGAGEPFIDDGGPLVFEQYTRTADLESIKKRVEFLGEKYGKLRIAKLQFVDC